MLLLSSTKLKQKGPYEDLSKDLSINFWPDLPLPPAIVIINTPILPIFAIHPQFLTVINLCFQSHFDKAQLLDFARARISLSI